MTNPPEEFQRLCLLAEKRALYLAPLLSAHSFLA
jgi:hypothetical protein